MATEFEQGMKALKAGKFGEARQLFDQYESKKGTAASTRAQLADAEAKLSAGELGPAAKLYVAVMEKNPGLPETYFGLTRVALFTGQLADALKHATAATQLAPKIPLSWTLLGLVHEASKDSAGAIELMLKGASLGAQSFLCQFNAGRVLASEGRVEEAVPFLKKAVQLEPKSADGLNALGFALKAIGKYEAAIAAFEQVRDLRPTAVESWTTLADLLFEVQEYKVAGQILDRGLAACGDHPALLEKALAVAMMSNQVEAGIDYVERELKLVPDHEQGWLNLAGLHLMAKDFTRSEAVAKSLLKRNPKNWQAWQHLGNLYEAIPKETEAADAYRKAISIAPKEWKPLTNLAALLVQSTQASKHTEAKALLEKAIELAPEGEHRPLYNLALAQVRLGKKKEALAIAKQLQKFVPADQPLHAEAVKLERNLAS